MKTYVIGGLVLVVLVGVAGWVYITRAPSAPSEAIDANTSVSVPPEGEARVEGEQVSGQDETYRIRPDESRVQFRIDEVLRGEDFTVVGETNQVAGDVVVADGDLAKTVFGPVRVNARTLKTDNTNRDGAIARAILRSEQDEFEFITFEAQSVESQPGAGSDGAVPVTITGDLTVSGVTRPVTFTGELEQLSETRIGGQAGATVLYKDFELTIPQVPFVASVEDEVLLEIDFVADRI